MVRQLSRAEIVYPDSDGQPMSDNTRQYRYIVLIKEGLEWLYINDPEVFIAGDLLWYPVEGHPEIRTAPDAMVAFGRPKGDRGSYQQWKEEGISPQVVFEVLSPGNRVRRMVEKLRFYERYGVEEYYIYDPDDGELAGFLRAGSELQPIEQILGWQSPRLGIRFGLEGLDLVLTYPGGERFLNPTEAFAQAEQERQRAEQERQRAEQERQRAEQERQRAEQERQRAEIAQQDAEQERRRSERLAARLRELGLDPETL